MFPTPPLTRTLLLHTGGFMWLDATAMTGPRINHEHYLQWIQGRPTVDLGLVSAALQTLAAGVPLQREPISHFTLNLASSSAFNAPSGNSAHLVAAIAALWCQYSSCHEPLTYVRAGETPSSHQPVVVLTGSGKLVQAPFDKGLHRYEFEGVNGWEEKVTHLAEALARQPVLGVHLFCPHPQLMAVREVILRTLGDRIRPGAEPRELRFGDERILLRLHPIVILEDVAGVLAGLAGLGEEQDLVRRRDELRTLRDKRITQGMDTDDVDREIRDIGQRLKDGTPPRANDIWSGRFRLVEFIGKGAFAAVWRAHDGHRNRTVAVRILMGRYRDDRSRVDRFIRGAQEMANLNHPHIVQIYEEYQRHGPHHFCVMEFMSGGSLRDAVLSERMSLAQAMQAIFDIGDALAHAHLKGLIHRDVNPSNVLLDRNDRAKLTDFDLVRTRDTVDTCTGGALGSLGYIDPRLYDNNSLPDERADIYSLAMTCIFVLTRRDVPPMPNPIRLVKEVHSSALRRVLIGALATRRSQRKYLTVEEFGRALHKAWNSSSGDALVRMAALRRLGRTALWYVLIVVAVLGMLIGVWQGIPSNERRSNRAVKPSTLAGYELITDGHERVDSAPGEAIALWRAGYTMLSDSGQLSSGTFAKLTPTSRPNLA